MKGLLLVNLGTPAAPNARALRRYLRQFLGDPRVLDMNRFGRFMLLELIILPFRPRKSAEAYRKVWDDERGSPLLYHGLDLADAVQQRMGDDWRVELAMRYGEPSIPAVMQRMREAGIDRIVVLPLFPQLASSSSGSAVQAVQEAANEMWNVPQLCTVEPFYDHPAFVRAFTAVGRPVLADSHADYVLFSFHGLPERQVRKSDDSGAHCLASEGCCDSIGPVNRNCYRAQCYATARALAAELELADDGWSVAFQSRLGRVPWIRPYFDEVLLELAARKVGRVAVFCPAFVADCLETLEEIGIRGRESYTAAGGAELTLVPSLNASDAWADAVVEIVRDSARELSKGSEE